MIEDHADGPSPSCAWVGTVDGPTFWRFADVWQLHGETLGGTDGQPSVHAYTFDGMNWEPNGESPVTYPRLHVVVT